MTIIVRPLPDADIAVEPFDGQLVRVAGLNPCDYLTAAEARELADALYMAVDSQR